MMIQYIPLLPKLFDRQIRLGRDVFVFIAGYNIETSSTRSRCQKIASRTIKDLNTYRDNLTNPYASLSGNVLASR